VDSSFFGLNFEKNCLARESKRGKSKIDMWIKLQSLESEITKKSRVLRIPNPKTSKVGEKRAEKGGGIQGKKVQPLTAEGLRRGKSRQGR